MNIQQAQSLVDSKQFWYHTFEIFPGVWTPGVYDASGTLNALDIPQDLSGKKVLEVGPADGFFTRELHKRGADVHAVDYCARDRHGFEIMEQCYGHRMNFEQINIYDLSPDRLGRFDIVLCLGVLYHLPDLFRGLWLMRQFCTESFHLESAVSEMVTDEPVAVYLPADSTNGDWTNFWKPTPRCIEAMMVDLGFILNRTDLRGSRAYFSARPNPDQNSQFKGTVAYSSPTW